MQTRDQISSPTFTGLWQDGKYWHVKYEGFWVGSYASLTAAHDSLEKRIRKCQIKRLQYQLTRAVRLNSLRLDPNQ